MEQGNEQMTRKVAFREPIPVSGNSSFAPQTSLGGRGDTTKITKAEDLTRPWAKGPANFLGGEPAEPTKVV